MAEIIVLFAAFDWIFRGGFVLIFQSAARVAELVDAHGSGPCDLTIMGVRVPPRAPVRPGQETGPVFLLPRKVFVALPGVLGLVLGLKDKKSWSEPDLSALWCGKVWFKVVGGQL